MQQHGPAKMGTVKMAEHTSPEVLLVSGLNNDQSSFSLWNLRTGNLIKSYRSNQQQGCFFLARSGRDYVLTSEEKKQVINIWEWSKEQAQKKIVCPEKVTALCCSPDGNYCLVALLDKIFIWQMPTGNLMKILSRHYQNVTNLKFTDNGSHFVSTGDDNLVLVWDFSSLLSRSAGDSSNGVSNEKPLHTWSDHSLPVKGIHVTAGGVRCRVATCSLDQTCKLYDLASGNLLCSFLLDIGLTAVTMDLSEYFVFLGGITGKIHALHLTAMTIKKEQTIINDSTCEHFLGHSKEVTKLSVNSNGDTLVSGSADCSVKFWHIKSGQCIKQIEFKGRITYLEVFKPLQDLSGPSSLRSLQPIENFKRNLNEPALNFTDSQSSENIIRLVLKDVDKDLLKSCNCKARTENQEDVDMALTLKIIAEKTIARNEESDDRNPKETSKMDTSELRERVDHLESLVRTLYTMNANRIMDQVASNNK